MYLVPGVSYYHFVVARIFGGGRLFAYGVVARAAINRKRSFLAGSRYGRSRPNSTPVTLRAHRRAHLIEDFLFFQVGLIFFSNLICV